MRAIHGPPDLFVGFYELETARNLEEERLASHWMVQPGVRGMRTVSFRGWFAVTWAA